MGFQPSKMMQDFATIHSMLEFQVPVWDFLIPAREQRNRMMIVSSPMKRSRKEIWVAEGEPSQVVMVKILNIDEHSNIVYDSMSIYIEWKILILLWKTEPSPDMFSFHFKNLWRFLHQRGFPLGRSERHATIAIWFQWMSGSMVYGRSLWW